MNGREIFATVVFALAVIGAVRVLKLVLSSLKTTIRALGATLQAVGEKLRGDDASESDEEPEPAPTPRPNRRRSVPAKQSIPTITDADIAAYLAKKGAAQAATGN